MNMLWLFYVVMFVPIGVWQVSFVAGVWLFCIGALIKQRVLRLGLLVTGSTMTFIAAVLLSCYAYAALCCWTQMVRSQSLYAGPSPVYHQIGTINEGELVRVCKTQGMWICVEACKIKGWLSL
jgi:hypothetical protein